VFIKLGFGLFVDYSDKITEEIGLHIPLTLADTNAFGNFMMHQFEGWQFSFESPAEIRDGINLFNTIPVNLANFFEVIQDPRWKGYGWLEITLNVQPDVTGKPFILICMFYKGNCIK
jgi:hypothetical protein